MADFAGPARLIHSFLEAYRAKDGTTFGVHVFGRERSDGMWIGWLEFHDGAGRVLRTDRETTQSTADQLLYWAEGLEPTYLDGALDRAARRR